MTSTESQGHPISSSSKAHERALELFDEAVAEAGESNWTEYSFELDVELRFTPAARTQLIDTLVELTRSMEPRRVAFDAISQDGRTAYFTALQVALRRVPEQAAPAT